MKLFNDNLNFKNILPEINATIQIIRIECSVFLVVNLGFNGWQIAYHLSTDMTAKVRTDTVTDTFYWKRYVN